MNENLYSKHISKQRNNVTMTELESSKHLYWAAMKTTQLLIWIMKMECRDGNTRWVPYTATEDPSQRQWSTPMN